MSGDSVKVAVRVRPFNGREKDRNATLIIDMIDKMTTITNPHTMNNDKPETKKFTFDYSYWSHSDYREGDDGLLIPTAEKYHDQKHVFDTLGMDVLNNAYKGYNCSLFAYGQTGSGKSFSMVGYGVNKGIVPITCDTIFKGIADNTDPKLQYRVSLSMLEIYNEAVRDLLAKEAPPKGGLKVRQHPKLGVQVVGLQEVPVGSYDEINRRIEAGTSNRTVAATNMNATSSRAHTVVAIMYTKVEVDGKGPGKNREQKSKINLVDLAGSERAESTGATGDRLKEGAAINLSLTMLGNVIKALAEKSNNPKSKVLIPYRDSKLTQILQDALGGNSKTIMIAALSPADINYEETLSTLRYADRAKQIKNKAVINIDPTELMIKKLKEDNAKLMAQLKMFTEGGDVDFSALMAAQGGGEGGEGGGGGGGGAPMTEEEKEAMKKQLQEEMNAEIEANQKMLEEQAKSWEDRYKESMAKYEDMDKAKEEEEARKAQTPHMINVNEDPALSNVVTRFFDNEVTKIGRNDAAETQDIVLGGVSILKEHATVSKDAEGKVTIEAMEKAKLMVNGKQITEATELHHHDRVMFGASHLYYFVHPKEKADGKEDREQTWESAQEEIARAQGFAPERKSFSNLTQAEQEQMLLQEEIVKVVPLVTEANDIGEELSKPVTFEVKILNKLVNGRYKPEVNVLVRNTNTLAEWIWPTKKFTNRCFLMREMYANWVDDPEYLKTVPEDQDPFWDPAEPVLIGDATVYLSPLAFLLDFEDQVDFRDYKGQSAGVLDIKIDPCNEDGSPIAEDDLEMPDDPKELAGKPLNYKVQIIQANGIDPRFRKGVLVKFVFFGTQYETKVITGTSNPQFSYSQVLSFPKADGELLRYLEHDAVHFEVWGEQEDKAPAAGHVAVRQRRASIHPAAFDKIMSARDTALNKALACVDDLVKEEKLKEEDAKKIRDCIEEAKTAGAD